MNQMETFKNPEFGSIRTFELDGKVLFCGKDIAKALGYQRTADAITAHCKGVCVLPTPSNGGIQRMKFIPEGDVYRLIVHSKLPSAERFERWVFDEVLPSIRKHGACPVPSSGGCGIDCKPAKIRGHAISPLFTRAHLYTVAGAVRPAGGCCVLRPRWGATLPKPLVRSAQPDTRFAFVRLHRACYPLTERRCSP